LALLFVDTTAFASCNQTPYVLIVTADCVSEIFDTYSNKKLF